MTATEEEDTMTANRIDEVWGMLSSADRHALLGHDHEALSADDRLSLARSLEDVRRATARPRRRRPSRR